MLTQIFLGQPVNFRLMLRSVAASRISAPTIAYRSDQIVIRASSFRPPGGGGVRDMGHRMWVPESRETEIYDFTPI